MRLISTLRLTVLLTCTLPLGACMSVIPIIAPGVDAEPSISADFPYESRYVEVLGSKMHYVEEGEGRPILLLHGNPTSSYLWRNVIPHLSSSGRVIAPDLIGMGKSDKPDLAYQLDDHIRYMDAFIDALDLNDVVLVLHDWGGGIGFDWAMRHPEKVRGIAFMEAVVRPGSWANFSRVGRIIFGNFRDEDRGYELIVEENYFVEKMLPLGAGRDLSDAEMNAYRAPYLEPASRKPILLWPREIPIDGEPARTHERIAGNYAKLQRADTPLLLLHAEPGQIIPAAAVARVKADIPRLQIESVGPGLHFIQESQPTNIGKAVRRFVEALDTP